MFTEFHHHQISFLDMTSNSDLFIIVEEYKKQTEFKVSSAATSEFPVGCQATASNHDPEEELNLEEEKFEATASSDQEFNNNKTPCLGEFEKVSDNNEDEDNDGFRTPTSSDHKIPVNTQCPPPAPKKLRPPPSSTKRKALSPPQLPHRRSTLQLDLSKEVESMFPPQLQDDLGRKINKRARRDDPG